MGIKQTTVGLLCTYLRDLSVCSDQDKQSRSNSIRSGFQRSNSLKSYMTSGQNSPTLDEPDPALHPRRLSLHCITSAPPPAPCQVGLSPSTAFDGKTSPLSTRSRSIGSGTPSLCDTEGSLTPIGSASSPRSKSDFNELQA